MSQSLYSRKILAYFGMLAVKPSITPLPPGTRYLQRKLYPSKLKREGVPLSAEEHRRYRKILGFFSYLVQLTRPDLAFAYSELSRHGAEPCTEHLEGANRMLSYLAGTWDMGLTFTDPGPRFRNRLTAWVDSDYASCPSTRRSHTGYLITMNNGPVAWKAKQQSCVTMSSAEAEFVAASSCGKQLLALRNLLRHLDFEQLGPTLMWEDNAACISMSKNPVNPDSAKHIDVACHKLRELVRNKVVVLQKVPTQDNLADALTKSLPGPAFLRHRDSLQGSKVAFTSFLCAGYLRELLASPVCGA